MLLFFLKLFLILYHSLFLIYFTQVRFAKSTPSRGAAKKVLDCGLVKTSFTGELCTIKNVFAAKIISGTLNDLWQFVIVEVAVHS